MITTSRLRLVRVAVSGAAAAVVVAALAGCSGIANPGAVTRASTSTVTSTATATATTTATTTAAPSSSASGFRVAGCVTGLLKGSLRSDGAAAGSTYYDLTLQNAGSKPCTLQGWPGTSFVDADGHQIGAAAEFDRSGTNATVTLLPNGHAVARLQVGQALNYSKSTCDPTTAVAGLRVYPPGSKASLIVKASGLTACRRTGPKVLQVQAFHAVS